MEAREKSLRVYDTKKTFFSKLSSTFTKLLTPTKTGINNLLISIKRTSVLKSYHQVNECKDDGKKEALQIPIKCIFPASIWNTFSYPALFHF